MEEQTKHLQNSEFIAYVDQNFGKVKSKTVIYNGADAEAFGVKYLNAETFLCRIHEMKLDKKVAFERLIALPENVSRTTEKSVKKIKKEMGPKL